MLNAEDKRLDRMEWHDASGKERCTLLLPLFPQVLVLPGMVGNGNLHTVDNYTHGGSLFDTMTGYNVRAVNTLKKRRQVGMNILPSFTRNDTPFGSVQFNRSSVWFDK